jgi:ArsR family transcriptional regulator, arsenate/arsenite/antimonite-responsive transcriptional repressor
MRCCPTLTGPLLSDSDAEELAAVFKALGDPVRVRLLNLIAQRGEVCACDLPDLLGRSQPTISHHLSILTRAGIIEREQRGKWAWFWLDRAGLAEACRSLMLPEDASLPEDAC